MANISDDDRLMIESITTPWKDEEQDRRELRRMFDEEKGKIKPALASESPAPDNPSEVVRKSIFHGADIEPLIGRWTDFFKMKYGEQKGLLLFGKYWHSVQIRTDATAKGIRLEEIH